jgi:hypothetical protein
MVSKFCRTSGLAGLFVLAVCCASIAGDASASGADFKGKTVEMKDKGEFVVLLSFSAGKEVTATTKGTKETDVHLFVHDDSKKEIGKDVSPGPNCEVKFIPAGPGTYSFLVKNSGGANAVTFEVKVAK